MSPCFKSLIACIFLALADASSVNAAPQGFLKGHLKILSRTPVEFADENTATKTATATAKNYGDYPLIILSAGERRQIARITADGDGNYRAALPPGDYILDIEQRVRRRLRVRTLPFTVVPNETAHVDITIVTGFGDEAFTPQK